MSLWSIVPVKPLASGKSRLARVLSDTERADLNRRLLQHTLEVLKDSPQIDYVLVISRDPLVLDLTRQAGGMAEPENGEMHLNAALDRARNVARKNGAASILVLPADLPGVKPLDIQELVAAAGSRPGVVIAPDRHRRGTNALLIEPPDLIDFAFGLDSFNRHCTQAVRAGALLQVVENLSIALDIDLPEDLEIAEWVLSNALR